MSIGLFFLTVVFLAVTELLLLVKVAALFGFGTTLLLCILTGIVGGYLVRQQGFRTLERMQSQIGAGRMPADEILEGIGLIVVGAFLMVPGFLTDVGGFLMLIPSLRRNVVRRIRQVCAQHVQVRTFGGSPFDAGPFDAGPANMQRPNPFDRPDGDVIDVDVEVRDDAKS